MQKIYNPFQLRDLTTSPTNPDNNYIYVYSKTGSLYYKTGSTEYILVTETYVADNFLSANTSYYTQSEADNKFVYVTGDTISGNLIVNANITGQTLNTTQKINLTSYSNTSVNGDLWYSGSELYFTSGSTDIDLLNKIPKVTGATGNLPVFTSSGEIEDSGIPAIQEDFDLIDFITLSAITSDSDTVIPSGYRITSVAYEELSGNSAGIITISTTAGNSGDVVSGVTVGSNSLVDGPLQTTIFSTSSSTLIYIESSSWGSSLVNVHIRIEKFIE